MKKLFYQLTGFNPKQHRLRTEFFAGFTTFFTMCYILAVNPQIMSSAGMDKGAVFSATILAAAVATLVMAFYAKQPLALAPGMGLNAFFAYTLVVNMGYTWQEALVAVFIEGIIFILLTIFKVREAIVNSVPTNLRYAISAGIGLFIGYIGLKNSGIIVGDPNELTTLGAWTPTALLTAIGILLGCSLLALRVPGALFYAIVAITLIGIPLGVTIIPEGFSPIALPTSIEPIAFKLDFGKLLSIDLNYYAAIFIMLFMDIFDTIGTLIGAATSAGMVKKDGEIPRISHAMMADAIGTTAGSLLGTSTVTTYAESSAGVVAGGRTGVTSFTVAILFLAALFLSPLFMTIPAAATACVLFLVGFLMLHPLKDINLADPTEAVPCFITAFTMPLTSSISEGIALGMIAYVIIKLFTRRQKDLSVVMYILAIFFILRFIYTHH